MCAKTLAYATGCRLAAVDTLEAIAANSPAGVTAVHVIANAQRGDIFVGTYHPTSEGEWVREGPPTILAAEAWMAALRKREKCNRAGLGSLSDAAGP